MPCRKFSLGLTDLEKGLGSAILDEYRRQRRISTPTIPKLRTYWAPVKPISLGEMAQQDLLYRNWRRINQGQTTCQLFHNSASTNAPKMPPKIPKIASKINTANLIRVRGPKYWLTWTRCPKWQWKKLNGCLRSESKLGVNNGSQDITNDRSGEDFLAKYFDNVWKCIRDDPGAPLLDDTPPVLGDSLKKRR